MEYLIHQYFSLLKVFRNNKNISFKKIDLTKTKISKKKNMILFFTAGWATCEILKVRSSTYKLNSLSIINLRNNLNKKGKFVYMSSTEV